MAAPSRRSLSKIGAPLDHRDGAGTTARYRIDQDALGRQATV
jgi:hypothetical protein